MRKFVVFFMLSWISSCENTVEKDFSSNLNSCIVTFIEGKCFLTNNDDTKMVGLTVGDRLEKNDIVKTGKDSAVELQIGGASFIKLKEESMLKIAELYKDDDVQKTNLFLKTGKVLAKPEKLAGDSSFEVETDSVTAGVRGTEFTVITDSHYARIAVKSGIVKVTPNIDKSAIWKLEKINPGLADNLKKSLVSESELTADEKIVINNNDLEKFNASLDKNIGIVINELEKKRIPKENPGSLSEKLIAIKINEIKMDAVKITRKSDVEEHEWENVYDGSEFDGMVINENEDEKPGFSKITKIGNPGIGLSGKNTALVSDDKNIYIISNLSNKVYCYDVKNLKISWVFSDQRFKGTFGYPFIYKNRLIISSFDAVYALDRNGKIKSKKDISNGPSFWVKPAIFKDNVLIPGVKEIYKYDNNTFEIIKDLDPGMGRRYITAYKNGFFIFDSLKSEIIYFDAEKKEKTWTTEKISSQVYANPVAAGKYLVVIDGVDSILRYDIETWNMKPEILRIKTGCTSNIIARDNFIYFTGNDGFFYRINLQYFDSFQTIDRIDMTPDKNTYFTKKIVQDGKYLLYSSDNGKIFYYNTISGDFGFINIDDNPDNIPLICAPLIIDGDLYIIDAKSDIYQAIK